MKILINVFSKRLAPVACMGLVIASLSIFSPEVMAQVPTKVTGFFDNLKSILSAVSATIVTIALIIAGYQIAFAHKRVIDVAPILIGALIIGAAAQIAAMLI